MNVKVVCLVVCMSSLVMGITDEELNVIRTDAEKKCIKICRDVSSLAYNAFWNIRFELIQWTFDGFEEKKDYAKGIKENIDFEVSENAKAARTLSLLMNFFKENETVVNCINQIEKKVIEDNEKYFTSLIPKMDQEKGSTYYNQYNYGRIWQVEYQDSHFKLNRITDHMIDEIYRTRIPSYIQSLVENLKNFSKDTERVVGKLETKLVRYGIDCENLLYRMIDNYKVISRVKVDEATQKMLQCL